MRAMRMVVCFGNHITITLADLEITSKSAGSFERRGALRNVPPQLARHVRSEHASRPSQGYTHVLTLQERMHSESRWKPSCDLIGKAEELAYYTVLLLYPIAT
eukprot:3617743-Pleurochrysis_carterae.AAC.1